jgi:hypothetical protein
LTAQQFIDRGSFDTKEKLRQWVYETAVMPADEYWAYQITLNYTYPRATAGEEPFASKWAAMPDGIIHKWEPRDIQFVVVGGETNAYWRLFGAGYQKTVSVDAWR